MQANVILHMLQQVISPDVVELWEALLTLAQFPVMVISAWLIDSQPWKTRSAVSRIRSSWRYNVPAVCAGCDMFLFPLVMKC